MGRDLVVFLVLLLLVVSSQITGVSELPSLFLFFLFSTAILVRGRRERERLDFINQLKSHRKELRERGTVVVDNTLLRYDTVLTSYSLTVGLLFADVVIPSRFRLYTGSEHPEAFVYSLCSLLSGWWSFPEGPLLTVNSIQQNLAGGDKTTVAELIDKPLLEQIASIREQRDLRQRLYAESKNSKIEDSPDTGPGSLSARELGKRRKIPQNKTLEQRLEEIYNPKPIGIVLTESLLERIRRKNNGKTKKHLTEKPKTEPFSTGDSLPKHPWFKQFSKKLAS